MYPIIISVIARRSKQLKYIKEHEYKITAVQERIQIEVLFWFL
ncbi:hypothetical protein ABNX05_25230 [Lysinibacillus sp. M3]|uniref:Uncharacterized protein n=1 Tax=Lysinibacillus zambalensis TaxID=3160866 RepID=A0ABV1N0F1_9BACI